MKRPGKRVKRLLRELSGEVFSPSSGLILRISPPRSTFGPRTSLPTMIWQASYGSTSQVPQGNSESDTHTWIQRSCLPEQLPTVL